MHGHIQTHSWRTILLLNRLSDIDELTKRINESDEDKLIFTIDNKSIEENINYVYDLYEKLDTIIKENKISYLKINSSQFQNDFDKMDEFIEKLKLNYIWIKIKTKKRNSFKEFLFCF